MTTPTGVVSDIPQLPQSVRRPTVSVERPGGKGGRGLEPGDLRAVETGVG